MYNRKGNTMSNRSIRRARRMHKGGQCFSALGIKKNKEEKELTKTGFLSRLVSKLVKDDIKSRQKIHKGAKV